MNHKRSNTMYFMANYKVQKKVSKVSKVFKVSNAKRVGIKLDQERQQRCNQQDPHWLYGLTKKLEQQRRTTGQGD